MCPCCLVCKIYRGTNVAISTVTWPHCMNKLTIEEVVEPHHMVIITVQVAKWEAMHTQVAHNVCVHLQIMQNVSAKSTTM